MLLNDSPLSYRVPRLRLLVNGQLLTGVCDAAIVSNGHFSADHFDAVIALGTNVWSTLSFWSSEPNILIDIQISTNVDSDYISMIQGFVDSISIVPSTKTVRISGRSFVAALIEAPTEEAFSNRTASEIAKLLAQRHNLLPRVAPTSTPVGRFYQSDYESQTLSRFSGSTTEWELLVYLARHEDYDVFVAGTSLFFQPTSQISHVDKILDPSNVMEITLQRALTLARGIQVTVNSWNTFQQVAFSESAFGTLNGSLSGGSAADTQPVQQYVLIRPNLTRDTAQAIARQRLSELSRHERTITLTMPGELTLTPRSTIMLNGTGTDFDQAYYIDSIERTFRTRTGFVQHMRASNSSPRAISVSNSA